MTVDVAALLARASAPPWQVHGRSFQGRPLTHRVWPAPGPAVLLFGAIHGDEPLGVAMLLALADLLDAGTPHARAVWIAPVVNPDGLLAGSKDNARGVDLNRNWPARSWRAEHPPGYHPGAAPASEPETQALATLIERSGARRFIALHSPFRTVNHDGPAAELAARMAARNGYGATHDIGYPTPGSFGACHGRDRGHEVITLEIPPLSTAQAWLDNRDALLEALAV
jgi:protein MpaA